MSTYDFSTLYATLPHHLIKDKRIDLIERTFSRENALYLARKEERAFFTSDVYKHCKLWFVKTFEKPLFIFWIIILLDLKLNSTDNYRYSDGNLLCSSCCRCVSILL